MYSLKDLQFPIYVVGNEKPEEFDNKLFFEYSDGSVSVLDDKNLDAPTLAVRRLVLQSQGTKLKSLTKAIFFISDMLKIATPSTWFIDSSGFLFRHIKRKRVPLIIYPIRFVYPIQSGGAVIEVEGIEQRFKTLFAPTAEKYAGVLKIGRIYVLYGLYDDKPANSWRKV